MSKNNKLQEKVDLLIPYIWERFIELDYEFDFAPTIRFHLLFDSDDFIVLKEYRQIIEIEEITVTYNPDFDKIWDRIIDFMKDYPKIKGKTIYDFTAKSPTDEVTNIPIRDIDYLLDTVIDFIQYHKDNKLKIK